VPLRISAAAIRTIEHKGGIDAFLRDTPDRHLSPEGRRLKRRIEKAAQRDSG
jgi:large subunit ribosomal protein L28